MFVFLRDCKANLCLYLYLWTTYLCLAEHLSFEELLTRWNTIGHLMITSLICWCWIIHPILGLSNFTSFQYYISAILHLVNLTSVQSFICATLHLCNLISEWSLRYMSTLSFDQSYIYMFNLTSDIETVQLLPMQQLVPSLETPSVKSNSRQKVDLSTQVLL